MCGISAEVAYRVQNLAFDYLDAPVVRLNSADTSLSYSQPYVDEYLPSVTKVVKAAKEILYIGV